MAKTTSWIFGVILVIAGIWGFFSPAFGFISANTWGSIIHLVAGLILIIMASKPSAGATLKTIGIIYILWSILGFLGWGFTGENMTTTWFYLILGVVLAVLGWCGHKGMGMSSGAPMSPTAPQM